MKPRLPTDRRYLKSDTYINPAAAVAVATVLAGCLSMDRESEFPYTKIISLLIKEWTFTGSTNFSTKYTLHAPFDIIAAAYLQAI